MNNTLVKSTSASLTPSNHQNATALVKVLVFDVGELKCAFRIETVYKVVNQTPVYGAGQNGVGIAHIGDREVTVVDLQQRLLNASSPKSEKNYLIVVQNPHNELYGISVSSVPSLMQIPVSSIRVLPQSYRQADILRSATHVCLIPQAEPLTIFLLDGNELLKDA